MPGRVTSAVSSRKKQQPQDEWANGADPSDSWECAGNASPKACYASVKASLVVGGDGNGLEWILSSKPRRAESQHLYSTFYAEILKTNYPRGRTDPPEILADRFK